MKILHIITGLEDGGAEQTLYKICKYDHYNEHFVISLKGPGKYYSLLKKLDIDTRCLNMKFYSIFKFFSLIRLIIFFKPNIVQTWLLHADFLGGIAAKLVGIKNIIWNIRYSNLKLRKTKFTSIVIMKLLSYLSFFIPSAIVVVSKKAQKIYKVEGYAHKKFVFIPNGYDISILKPNKIKREKFRNKIKIKENTLLIGNVARYDPKKDHANLLKALSSPKLRNCNFFVVFVGTGMDKQNNKLNLLSKKLQIGDKIKFLGKSNDVSQIMNGIDVYVQSSSFGEGFPNVVAEAMSCGTPCIVTNVGDAATIVDKNGWIVPPNDPSKLANKIRNVIDQIGTKKWNKKSLGSRLRIKKFFCIKKMINSYNQLWIKFKGD